MKITYISSFDASNIGSYSGTGYYIPKKLEESGDEVSYIGNLNKLNPVSLKAKKKILRMLGRNFLIERDPGVMKKWADHIQHQIPEDTEVLVGYSSQPFSMLKTKKPMVIWTDAIFANMVDFYEVYSSLVPESLKNGNAMEKAALENVNLAVFSSDWAANAAKEYYKIPKEKVKVIPYGANIDIDFSSEEIEKKARQKPDNLCNLLFIGVEWQRKGGDKAVEIASEMNKAGIKTKLSIVGTEVKDDIKKLDFTECHGFISKSTGEGRTLLNRIIGESHFLVLPTRADCTPIVFNEFNAHGIPVITTNVGGVPTIIKNNINGYTFDLNAPAGDYTQVIKKILNDKEKYVSLALKSHHEYKTRLNWETSISKFREYLNEVIG
ncbi:MAG: glycosyltransferase family 4 protein [Cyclobacteriaceae bacterium]